MKKLLIALIISVAAFSSCKKYEDGPAISFRSFHSRLYHLWTVEKYIIDGADSTQLFNDSCGCSYSFNHSLSDEIRLIAWGGKNGPNYHNTPTDFTNKNKTIYVYVDPNGNFNLCRNTGPLCYYPISYSLTITRLTKKELWLKTDLNNKNYFIKLIHS